MNRLSYLLGLGGSAALAACNTASKLTPAPSSPLLHPDTKLHRLTCGNQNFNLGTYSLTGNCFSPNMRVYRNSDNSQVGEFGLLPGHLNGMYYVNLFITMNGQGASETVYNNAESITRWTTHHKIKAFNMLWDILRDNDPSGTMYDPSDPSQPLANLTLTSDGTLTDTQWKPVYIQVSTPHFHLPGAGPNDAAGCAAAISAAMFAMFVMFQTEAFIETPLGALTYGAAMSLFTSACTVAIQQCSQ